MQQVIAGRFKGKRLLSLPKGCTQVRPTSSRVRGAIFDRLQNRVQGARVLDLFAGSGANAIEALSRGASHATLVELQPRIHQFLKRQLTALGLCEQTALYRGDARSFLSRRRAALPAFDLVLCDPPYAQVDLYEEVLGALQASDLLAPSAQIVVERALRAPGGDTAPSDWTLLQRRRYGDTELLFWCPKE